PRLGHPDIASFTVTLLGMADGGPLHRALHGAGTTARADVQTAQSQLVAYAFAVQVFLTADGVTAPAHDEAWRDTRAQQGGIAQHIEDQRAVHIHRALDVDGVGAFRVIVVTGTVGLPRHEHDVAQHSKQMITHAIENDAVHEGAGRRVFQQQLDAAWTL